MMKYICKSTRIFLNRCYKNKFQLSFVNKLDYANTCQLWSPKSKDDLALHEITCTLYSFQWYSYFGVIKGVVDIFIIYTWWYFKVANIRFHLAPLQYWVAHSGRMVKNCRWCNSQVYVILLFYNMMQYPNELIQFLNIS